MASTTRTAPKGNSKSEVTATDIEKSLSQVKKDIASLTETLALYGKDKALSAGDAASQKSQDVIDSSAEAVEQLKKQIDVIGDNLGDQVRKKPIQTIAIAAGIGAVLALIAKR